MTAADVYLTGDPDDPGKIRAIIAAILSGLTTFFIRGSKGDPLRIVSPLDTGRILAKGVEEIEGMALGRNPCLRRADSRYWKTPTLELDWDKLNERERHLQAAIRALVAEYGRDEKDSRFEGGPSEWGWEDAKTERCIGGFKSREEAIQHARDTSRCEEWYEDRKINIGRTVWPEPAEYLRLDAGDLAATMDENAFDDGCFTNDEPLFDFDDQKKAQEELVALLRRWANKHLAPCAWTFHAVEHVMIGPGRQEPLVQDLSTED
jgi:hypothetical protein